MAKRIGILILSTAIIVVGIIAFNRLNYWKRSVRIFTIKNEQSNGRSYKRDRGDFSGSDHWERSELFGDRLEIDNFRSLRDSTRRRIITQRNSNASPGSLPESRLPIFPAERENVRTQSYEQGGRHGRNDFRRRNQIQLANVIWFLAVFALFTTVTSKLDNAYAIIKKKYKIDKLHKNDSNAKLIIVKKYSKKNPPASPGDLAKKT